MAKVVDGPVILVKAEGGGIGKEAVHGAGLARHALDEHAYCHARWERVRVDDHVRNDTVFGKGHVVGGPERRQHSLLPVAARKLVADDGPAVVAQFDAHAQQRFPGAVAHEAHLIYLNVMTYPRYTPLVSDLPSTVPFVGPESQERDRKLLFDARLGANENMFGPSPKALAALKKY